MDMCASGNVSEAYPSMEGEDPVVATAVWSLPGHVATAVALQAGRHHRVAYVGTAVGHLIKVSEICMVCGWALYVVFNECGMCSVEEAQKDYD